MEMLLNVTILYRNCLFKGTGFSWTRRIVLLVRKLLQLACARSLLSSWTSEVTPIDMPEDDDQGILNTQFLLSTILFSRHRSIKPCGSTSDDAKAQLCTLLLVLNFECRGARVQLSCRNQDTGAETYNAVAVTGLDGKYKIPLKSDHELDVCEVKVLSSPDPLCNVISDEIDNVKVSLAKNSGIDSTTRFANPIGFVRKAPMSKCNTELKKMGYEFDY